MPARTGPRASYASWTRWWWSEAPPVWCLRYRCIAGREGMRITALQEMGHEKFLCCCLREEYNAELYACDGPLFDVMMRCIFNVITITLGRPGVGARSEQWYSVIYAGGEGGFNQGTSQPISKSPPSSWQAETREIWAIKTPAETQGRIHQWQVHAYSMYISAYIHSQHTDKARDIRRKRVMPGPPEQRAALPAVPIAFSATRLVGRRRPRPPPS